MDICPICKTRFPEYINKEKNCICPICLVSYQKLTHLIDGLSICFRNPHLYGRIIPVIEGRDCDMPINIFYLNNIRCIVLIAADGTLIYKKKSKYT